MITFPVPSCRTTRAMAHFLRPVPIIVCAANPPGSRDLTYFLRFVVSSSAGEATVADITSLGVLRIGATEMDFGCLNKRKVFGCWEIWEENEREENEDVREDIERAIVIWRSETNGQIKLQLQCGGLFERMGRDRDSNDVVWIDKKHCRFIANLAGVAVQLGGIGSVGLIFD